MTGGSQTTDREPRLPDLVGPLWRRLGSFGRVALIVIVLAILVSPFAYRSGRATPQDRVTYEEAGVPAFTLQHSGDLGPVDPADGEILRLESTVDGVLKSRMAVEPLEMDLSRPGEIGARLPLDAVAYERRARERFRGLRTVMEGRIRLNGVESYQLAFSAIYTDPDGRDRRLLGKIVLVPEDTDRPREGLAIEMLATSLAGISNAAAVGNDGELKRPFRSLRLLERRPS